VRPLVHHVPIELPGSSSDDGRTRDKRVAHDDSRPRLGAGHIRRLADAGIVGFRSLGIWRPLHAALHDIAQAALANKRRKAESTARISPVTALESLALRLERYTEMVRILCTHVARSEHSTEARKLVRELRIVGGTRNGVQTLRRSRDAL